MKEVIKMLVYMVVSATAAMFVIAFSIPKNYQAGDRFIVRRGGEIELRLLEEDPVVPVFLQAVGSSYFRIKSLESGVQFTPVPTEKPLGYYRDDYFLLADFPNSKGILKVIEGKGKIEVKIDIVMEDQEIGIRYDQDRGLKILVGIAAFVGVILVVFLCEEYI